MLVKVLDRYKFVLLQVWDICSKPNDTLSYESLLNTFYGKKILKHFILPLAELFLVATFVVTLISIDFNVVESLVKSILSYFSFIVSYGVLVILTQRITIMFFGVDITQRNATIMSSVLMTIVFVVKILSLLMPYFSIFYLYTFYLVWVMSEGVVDISEDKRNKYMVLLSLLVIFAPIVIEKIFKFLTPNL